MKPTVSNLIRWTAVIQGDKHMYSKIKESSMKPTVSNLVRWAGLAAMAAGIIFVGIQPIHPPTALASVTTGAWAIITPFKTAMCLFFLVGLAGIYARQVEKAGWLGLAGYLLLSLSWALNLALIFAEAFILPLLAPTAPTFVESFLGIFNGQPGEMNVGALPVLYALGGFFGYLLGGLLFGIATVRAGILPRWAGGLLAVAAVSPLLLSSLLPHPHDRMLAVPMGLAVAWLGYALWSERRAQAAESVPGKGSLQLRQTEAK